MARFTRSALIITVITLGSGAALADKTPDPLQVTPKPLAQHVNKGLSWLVKHQLPDGGWGQGEESSSMGRGMAVQTTKANVADTCMATLALLRSGSTPATGPHAASIMKALGYVMKEIEAADADSMYVTTNRSTRVQGKLGPYIDTFVSAQLLAEVRGRMPNEDAEDRLMEVLDKVLAKIRKNQKKDGTWGGSGWAPVLSQAVAGKAINRAAQAGVDVDEELRERTETYAKDQYDATGDTFSGEGGAGVGLYSAAASVGTMSDSVSSNELEEEKVKDDAENAPTEKARDDARRKLARFEATKKSQRTARSSLMKRLEDPRFSAGFGSNGGEEFLSYMLVSESLVNEGGKQWKAWDALMTKSLSRVQNRDGSWTGHHCITGRTFVTSAALLVLMADRAPAPLASKIRRG